MIVDIGKQLIFPPVATILRPDLVPGSPSLKSVYITELTVLRENSADPCWAHRTPKWPNHKSPTHTPSPSWEPCVPNLHLSHVRDRASMPNQHRGKCKYHLFMQQTMKHDLCIMIQVALFTCIIKLDTHLNGDNELLADIVCIRKSLLYAPLFSCWWDRRLTHSNQKNYFDNSYTGLRKKHVSVIFIRGWKVGGVNNKSQMTGCLKMPLNLAISNRQPAEPK